MDQFGKMMINTESASVEDIPRLMARNLATNDASTQPVIINEKGVNKIIRYTLIQRNVNTPTDIFQQLLNAVGNFYMAMRIEVAGQFYQTSYDDLEADKKAVVDDVVPMMVTCTIPKEDINFKQEKTYSKYSGDKIPAEEEWKKVEAEIEKAKNRQITAVVKYSDGKINLR